MSVWLPGCTDNASATDVDGQQGRGYSGPTTATVELAPPSPARRSRGRLYHVTVGETPGGRQADYLPSDVTDNDVNDRRLETLQVSCTPGRTLSFRGN